MAERRTGRYDAVMEPINQQPLNENPNLATFLESFRNLPTLLARIEHVLRSLPTEVQKDFLQDPRFVISLDNYQAGKGSSVFMAVPGANHGSRSIVLKPLLDQCSEDFAHYVIAHEFAHAFLRNGPWDEITNVEEAADALAAHWGYPKPAETPWGRWRR